MNNKFLITTALQETFPRNKDEEVIFLGEWCRTLKTRDIWQSFNFEVKEYHWDDRKKVHNDYQNLQTIYESVLPELSSKLNQIHNTNNTLIYWRILIGPWLRMFIGVLFDRFSMLQSVFEDKQLYKLKAITRQPFNSVPNDMKQFQQLVVTDDWNESIYTQLIVSYWRHLVEIEWIAKENEKSKYKINSSSPKTYIKNKILPSLNNILTREADIFFIETYLPLKAQLKLQIQLGQMPTLWKSKDTPVVNPLQEYRNWHLEKKGLKTFERVLMEMVPTNIPTAYLEGYKKLNNVINKLYWPKYPKSIFTSNSFHSDDIFKGWAADKTNTNTPLIIGQHGGFYGMNLFSAFEEHEIKIAEKYISWGWDDKEKKQIKPIGNIRCFESHANYDPNGGALMVGLTLPRYSYHMQAMPIAGQFLKYFDDQKKFLFSLPDEIQRQVTFRLSRADYGWNQAERWKESMPQIELDSGQENIKLKIKKSRLYITTYNATTFLESMTWNIPTIIFWNKKYWELNDQAKIYFGLLEEAGIFHSTPESAAKKMIDIWDDVDNWWNSSEIQKAKEIFINQYSKIPKDPLKSMKMVLTRGD